MLGAQRFDCFYFYDKAIFNKKIGIKVTDDTTPEHYLQRNLLDYLQAMLL